jgi:hypothetical protein
MVFVDDENGSVRVCVYKCVRKIGRKRDKIKSQITTITHAKTHLFCYSILFLYITYLLASPQGVVVWQGRKME